jgi:hypothetical protein
MNCNTGVTPIELEECNCPKGIYYSTECITNPNIITYLSLPANSSMTEIITALVLALQYKDEQLNNLQTQINNLTNV